MNNYPAEMPIRTLNRPVNCTISVPGSKSITNRALILAAMMPMNSDCTLVNALQCEDSEVMIGALRMLGISIETEWDAVPPTIVFPFEERRGFPARSADLFVGNSGTTMRFLTAMVATGEGRYRLDGTPRMRERPIQELLDALVQLGVDAKAEQSNGCPPVIIETRGLQSGTCRIDASRSSQFISALLLAIPFADADITIQIEGETSSKPYIAMTVSMLEQWDIPVAREGNQFRTIAENWAHNPMSYFIEPDATAASYMYSAAAILGGSMSVPGVKRTMLQGDIRYVEVLGQMGCQADNMSDGIRVSSDPLGRKLTGVDVDMNDISDTVPTLAAVACFANSPTTIRNIAHIRHKESDRISAMTTELRKLGVEVEEYPDGMKITPRPMTGCVLETYDDHRMAMSLALIGLKVPGVVIRNPGCVAKTYPGFWQDFEKLYESAS